LFIHYIKSLTMRDNTRWYQSPKEQAGQSLYLIQAKFCSVSMSHHKFGT